MEFASQGEAPVLPMGTVLEIVLQFRQEQLHLTGEVRRQQGLHCGLLFIATSGAEAHQQSARLHNLVVLVQQYWLKSRLK